jgi:hypothetical protein
LDDRSDRVDGELLELRREMRAEFIEVRGELAQMKLFMLAQTVAILGAVLPLYFR